MAVIQGDINFYMPIPVALKIPLGLQLVGRDILNVLADNRIRHLPDLQEIVFRCRTKNPGIAEIPAEIRDSIGVTTMHEQTEISR